MLNARRMAITLRWRSSHSRNSRCKWGEILRQLLVEVLVENCGPRAERLQQQKLGEWPMASEASTSINYERRHTGLGVLNWEALDFAPRRLPTRNEELLAGEAESASRVGALCVEKLRDLPPFNAAASFVSLLLPLPRALPVPPRAPVSNEKAESIPPYTCKTS